MSLGTLERTIEMIEINIKKCVDTYVAITNDSIPIIKESCNSRLKYSRALEDTWIPRLENENYNRDIIRSEESEPSKIDVLYMQQLKAVEKFADIKRLLKAQVTKSQNYFKTLQKAATEFIQEYGDSIIFSHSFNGKSLILIGIVMLKLGNELESTVDNLLLQYTLQLEILDGIEDSKLLRHSAAMNYVSIWTHLPYL